MKTEDPENPEEWRLVGRLLFAEFPELRLLAERWRDQAAREYGDVVEVEDDALPELGLILRVGGLLTLQPTAGGDAQLHRLFAWLEWAAACHPLGARALVYAAARKAVESTGFGRAYPLMGKALRRAAREVCADLEDVIAVLRAEAEAEADGLRGDALFQEYLGRMEGYVAAYRAIAGAGGPRTRRPRHPAGGEPDRRHRPGDHPGSDHGPDPAPR